MTWDNSPWAIEGGQTSADVGRLLARIATNNTYGILEPTHLRVRAKDTPGGQVLVGPGAVTVPVKALGKYLQSYIGLNPTDDPVDIPATGSGSGRSDLIVARVENPINGEPWQENGDPINQQYIFSRRYNNVPAGTTHVNQVDPSASAFTLARIDIPANTATITSGMITDLRGKPQTGEPPLPSTPMAAANQDVWIARHFDRATADDIFPYTQQAYAQWPDAAVYSVVVPKDATEVVADFSVTCEQRITQGQSATNNAYGNVWGYLRLRVVGVGVDFSIDAEFDKDYTGGGTPTTVTIPVGGTEAVPAAARGKSVTFQLESRMFNDGNTKGRLVITRGSYIRGHIHFNVRPSAS